MYWTELEVSLGKSSKYISALNRYNDGYIVKDSGYVRLDANQVPLRAMRSCRHEVFVIIKPAVNGCWDI